MDDIIKAQWVTALRSGKYTQGQGALHSTETDTYCCLGVLCELAAQAGVVKRISGVDFADGEMIYRASEFDASWTFLPQAVQEWAGITSSDGSFVPLADIYASGEEHLTAHRAVRTSLASLNDDGIEFPQIADTIEEYL